VLTRAGLTSVAATEPVCWARNRGVRVVYRPWLNRAGLHLLKVMCCCRAKNTGMSRVVLRAEPTRDMSLSTRSCNEVIKVGCLEQNSVGQSSKRCQATSDTGWEQSVPFHDRCSTEKPRVRCQARLNYLRDSFKCNYILTRVILCLSHTHYVFAMICP
jgi:hypothetical protein